MILSDRRILEEIERGTIVIEPYRRECLGSNSYDVHLDVTIWDFVDSFVNFQQ